MCSENWGVHRSWAFPWISHGTSHNRHSPSRHSYFPPLFFFFFFSSSPFHCSTPLFLRMFRFYLLPNFVMLQRVQVRAVRLAGRRVRVGGGVRVVGPRAWAKESRRGHGRARRGPRRGGKRRGNDGVKTGVLERSPAVLFLPLIVQL